MSGTDVFSPEGTSAKKEMFPWRKMVYENNIHVIHYTNLINESIG
jgi:hypothetical protein